MGPVFGGWLGETIGFRNSFFCIGTCCLLGFLALTQVHETPKTARMPRAGSPRPSLRRLPQRNVILGVFLTTVLLHFSLTCVAPLLAVYIQEIAGNIDHLAIISGTVFSAAGFASMLFASRFGKLADRIGSERILFSCLLLSGLVSIPQGFVTAPWQLGVLRFFHGIAIAGLMPSTNNLIRQLSPPALMGRIFGFNQSAQFIGMFSGAFFGGQLAALIGIRSLFLLVAALLIVNAIWCKFTIKTL